MLDINSSFEKNILSKLAYILSRWKEALYNHYKQIEMILKFFYYFSALSYIYLSKVVKNRSDKKNKKKSFICSTRVQRDGIKNI